MVARGAYVLGLLVSLGGWSSGQETKGSKPSGDGPSAVSNRTAVRFFEPMKVWEVHVELSASEFAAMQPRGGFGGFGTPAPKTPFKDDNPKRELHRNTFGVDLPWAVGTFTIDGTTFKNVGIRYKGNGTIGDSNRLSKKSLRIDFDRHGETAKFQGLKTVNLHSGVADPSKIRESLGYRLYADAGVPSPRTTLAEVRVSVPGKFDKELYGIYTAVEHIDRPFLKHHFGDDGGLLMKPEGVRELLDQGDEWSKFAKTYDAKREPTAAEFKRFKAFLELLHKADDKTFAQQIGRFVDIEGYLRYLAVTSYVANADSFFSLGHNFYLYLHPKTEKFHFFPWDLDRAFSNLPVLGSNSQQMNLSVRKPYAGSHKLTDRIFADPAVEARYKQIWKELAPTVFAKERVLNLVESYTQAVKEPLQRDAAAAAGRKESGRGFGPAAFLGTPPSLKMFVSKRTASIEAQMAGTSKGHEPVGGFTPGAFKIGDFVGGPLLETMDTDGDEKLSKKEWTAYATRIYAESDKAKQGWIDEKLMIDALNEMINPQPPGVPQPKANPFSPGNFMAAAIVKRIGPDKDGRITREKMVQTAESIFDEFDKDKSGKLDETRLGELLDVLFPIPKFGAPPKK